MKNEEKNDKKNIKVKTIKLKKMACKALAVYIRNDKLCKVDKIDRFSTNSNSFL